MSTRGSSRSLRLLYLGTALKRLSLPFELGGGARPRSPDQRQEEKRSEDDKLHMYECSYGAFTRSIALPDGVELPVVWPRTPRVEFSNFAGRVSSLREEQGMKSKSFGVAVAFLCWLSAVGGRAEDRERDGSDRAGARIAASLVAGLGGAGAAFAAGYGVGKLQHGRCVRANESDGECWKDGAIPGFAVASVVWPITVTVSAQLTHRSLGGQPRWWTGTVGGVAGTALGLAGATAVAASNASEAAFTGTLVGAALVSVAIPVLALEWSHRHGGRDLEREPTRTARLRVTAQGSPRKDGFWLGLVGTL
jgi:hypothetical protein